MYWVCLSDCLASFIAYPSRVRVLPLLIVFSFSHEGYKVTVFNSWLLLLLIHHLPRCWWHLCNSNSSCRTTTVWCCSSWVTLQLVLRLEIWRMFECRPLKSLRQANFRTTLVIVKDHRTPEGMEARSIALWVLRQRQQRQLNSCRIRDKILAFYLPHQQ